MQIVIDIPEMTYNLLKSDSTIDWLDATETILGRIVDGIVLPKGHGDLYDYNDLSKLVDEDFRLFLSRLDLKLPQPIIRADKENAYDR